MRYTLAHADTCLPDYWSGHHLPHISVPVDGTTTVKETLEAVRSEVSQGAVAGSLDWEVIESEEFHTACMKAVQELIQMNADILDKAAFPNLEVWDEDDCLESVMAFFVFVPEEEEEEEEEEESA